MQRISYLIVASVLSLACQAQDQDQKDNSAKRVDTEFGVKGGMNVSFYNASEITDLTPKLGPHLGLYLKSWMGGNAFLRPELYYSNEGVKSEYIDSSSGSSVGSTTTSVHYLNIPVLFEVGRKVAFQVGPQVGLFLAGTLKGEVQNARVNENLKEETHNLNLGVVFGLGYTQGRFGGGIRYNLGLSDTYSGDEQLDLPFESPKIYSRVFHFYVATSL